MFEGLLAASKRWEKHLHWMLGVGLAVVIAYSFWSTVGKPDCQDFDFGAYYRAGVAVRQGQSPYRVDEHGYLGVYLYAPAFAYLFIPLSDLDYLWACRLWMLFNWALTAVGLLLALKLTLEPGTEPRMRWLVAVLAVTPTVAYLWANLRVGQVAMLLLVACLGWASCYRAGCHFLAGVLLACASALKLAPLALVPYLILRRDWRGLAGVGVGGCLLALIPYPWVGLDGAVRLHREWFEHCITTQVPLQTYRPGNQSLLAQLARLPPVSDGHHLLSPEALAMLMRGYPFVVSGLALCLYIWIWRQCRNKSLVRCVEQSYLRDSAHLALLLVFLTFMHPRAWRCNLVALLQPCILLAQEVWLRRPRFWAALAGLMVVFLASVWPTHGIGEHGWSCVAWLLLGKHFWGGVVVAWACWQISRAPALPHPDGGGL